MKDFKFSLSTSLTPHRKQSSCALVRLEPISRAAPQRQTSASIQNPLKSVWLHRKRKTHQHGKSKFSSTSGQVTHIKSAVVTAAKPTESAEKRIQLPKTGFTMVINNWIINGALLITAPLWYSTYIYIYIYITYIYTYISPITPQELLLRYYSALKNKKRE